MFGFDDTALEYPVNLCIALTAGLYVLSEITGNVSQVDRLWSFLPTIYAGYFALLPLWPQSSFLSIFPYTPAQVDPRVSGEFNPRALIMFALTVSLVPS